MGLKVYLDGKFVDSQEAKISIFDHGLLYGDGVFEGIRSYGRRVFRLDSHTWRLYKSADSIRLNIPMLQEEFKTKIIDTLKINDLDNAYIRVVVSRGVGDLGLDPRKCKVPTIFIITDKIKLYPQDYYDNGLEISIAKTKRNHPLSLNPQIKSLNYLNNILAKIEAIDEGTEEAIMLSIDGHVAECTGDNIFIFKDGQLLTPSDEVGSLAGITQKAVIELAEKRGINTKFKKMFPEELFESEECFLTGTAAEIIPVIKIGNKIIGNGKPGELTKTLLDDFRELTKTDGEAY